MDRELLGGRYFKCDNESDILLWREYLVDLGFSWLPEIDTKLYYFICGSTKKTCENRAFVVLQTDTFDGHEGSIYAHFTEITFPEVCFLGDEEYVDRDEIAQFANQVNQKYG